MKLHKQPRVKIVNLVYHVNWLTYIYNLKQGYFLTISEVGTVEFKTHSHWVKNVPVMRLCTSAVIGLNLCSSSCNKTILSTYFNIICDSNHHTFHWYTSAIYLHHLPNDQKRTTYSLNYLDAEFPLHIYCTNLLPLTINSVR